MALPVAEGAAAELLEALNFSDVFAEVAETEWAAGVHETFAGSRVPTAVEAAQGTAAIGAVVGLQPAAVETAKAITASRKRKDPASSGSLPIRKRPRFNVHPTHINKVVEVPEALTQTKNFEKLSTLTVVR